MAENNQFTEPKPDDRKEDGTDEAGGKELAPEAKSRDEEGTEEGAVENPHQESQDEDTSEGGSTGASIFDNLDALRKRQDFDSLVGARRQLTSVPVGRPGKQIFFRVLPGDEWQIQAALIELDEDKTKFFVVPDIYPDLVHESKRVVLRTVITAQGTAQLWPIPLPMADGYDNEWWQSARMVADRAEQAWVRMASNRESRSYDVYTATADFGEPQVPEQSLPELLKIAFAGKIIDSLHHPVVLKLLGRSQ